MLKPTFPSQVLRLLLQAVTVVCCVPTQVRRFVMLSNQPFQPRQSPNSQWMQSLQDKIQGWIRTEIIAEDPCDVDQLTAQKLYEEFQALEKLPKVQPYVLPQRSSSY
jgi:hypothetical protein